MATEVDFSELLGIAPGASAEEIRRAYRRAALEYHPDSRRDDPHAAAVFSKITEAYRAAMRFRRRGLGERAATPQDFAKRNWHAPTTTFVPVRRRENASWLERLGGRRLALPTRNENAIFVCFWVVAVALTLVAVRLMGELYLAGKFQDSLGVLDVAIFAAVPLAAYAAAVTATLAAIVLTRQIVYLAVQLRLAWQRALPSPEEPLGLPRPAGQAQGRRGSTGNTSP